MQDITDKEHPWASAWTQFNELTLPLLKEHGERIGKSAFAGDALANKIMRNYDMLHRSFDPVTLIVLDEALAEWVALPEPNPS